MKMLPSMEPVRNSRKQETDLEKDLGNSCYFADAEATDAEDDASICKDMLNDLRKLYAFADPSGGEDHTGQASEDGNSLLNEKKLEKRAQSTSELSAMTIPTGNRNSEKKNVHETLQPPTESMTIPLNIQTGINDEPNFDDSFSVSESLATPTGSIHVPSSNTAAADDHEQISFFVDSPYFDAFGEEELRDIEIASSTIKDIRRKIEAFSLAGIAMAKATQDLSMSCQLRNNEKGEQQQQPSASAPEEIKRALGEEMSSAIQRFGQVLEQIGIAQQTMCKSVENALGPQLEEAMATEVEKISMLKEEVKSRTDNADKLFFRYLNGPDAGGHLVQAASVVVSQNATDAEKVKLMDNSIRLEMKKLGIREGKTLRTLPRVKSSSDLLTAKDIDESNTFNASASTGLSKSFTMKQRVGGLAAMAQARQSAQKRQSLPQTRQLPRARSLRDLWNRSDDDDEPQLQNSKARRGLWGQSGDDDDQSIQSTNSSRQKTKRRNVWGQSGDDDDQSIQNGVENAADVEANSKVDIGLSIDSSSNKNGKDVNEMDKVIKEWKLLLNNICFGQATAEYRRFELFKYITDSKCRRAYQLSKSIDEVCGEIEGYFVLCSELLRNAASHVRKAKETTEKYKKYHETHIKSMLTEKEFTITENLSKMHNKSKKKAVSCTVNQANAGKTTFQYFVKNEDKMNKLVSAAFANHPHKRTMRTSSMFNLQLLLESIENKIGLWDIPTKAIACLPYRRTLPPGVLMEGWLYEEQKQKGKESGVLRLRRTRSITPEKSPSLRWKKKWCMVKFDGIYYLKEKSKFLKHNNCMNDGSVKSLDRECKSAEEQHQQDFMQEFYDSDLVKICDIDLCSVREARFNPSERFCFEVILPATSMSLSPSNALAIADGDNVQSNLSSQDNMNDKEHITFQARGPKELREWINGIRSASIGGDYCFGPLKSLEIMNSSFNFRNAMSSDDNDDLLGASGQLNGVDDYDSNDVE